MSLLVTILDEQTGETEVKRVPDGEFLLAAAAPCHVAHVAAYASGTRVVTIRDCVPQPEPHSEEAARG